nr:cytochrome c oxidase accessory protein CcoG [uncultured Rhodopila sp.]
MSRISKVESRLRTEQDAVQHHLYADRLRIYPKSVRGPVRRIKWAILIACLTIYYVLPWVRWYRGPNQPSQAVLLDLSTQRFYFFSLELWPQDIWLLAGILIMAAVSLFLVTSLIGRVWCGYTCPQTVWTDLFMWIEREIEGDRNERMARDAAPLNADTIWKKVVKHGIWLFIAFWTGGAWIMYFVDAPTVTVDFWTGEAATPVYVFTWLFTLTTYGLAGWAREQVCTYMCPWPRFQAAMLDDQSFTVTYQAWRGEPRLRGKRAEGGPAAGDCVDCSLCVTVCPTGIDIRDGIQLECINCGLCMDACNHVMERTGRPKGLIAWDTLARQAAKKLGTHEPIRFFRPRTMIYVTALTIAVIGLSTALLTRSTLGLSVLRDRAPLFVPLADGSLRNGYTLKIVNKSQTNGAYDLSISGLPDAKLAIAEGDTTPGSTLRVLGSSDEVETFRLLVTARPAALTDGSQPVDFILRDTTTGAQTVYHSVFMGPAGYAGGTR